MTKVNELCFRDMYHQIAFIKSNENIISVMKGVGFSGENSNGVLVYGYIDHEMGFTFEILCWASDTCNEINVYPGNDEATVKLRRGTVSDCEIVVLGTDDFSAYQDKIDMVNEAYQCEEGVDITRSIHVIDECRNDDFPDDVMVYVVGEGKQPEGCWVRCIGIVDNKILGKLLNEPSQDFGAHCGDVIGFGVMKQEEHNLCVAEL